MKAANGIPPTLATLFVSHHRDYRSLGHANSTNRPPQPPLSPPPSHLPPLSIRGASLTLATTLSTTRVHSAVALGAAERNNP